MMRTPSRTVRAALAVAALAVLAVLTGCGTHDIVLKVDILSFSPNLQQAISYPGSIPMLPTPISGDTTIVPSQPINLVSGLGDATNIKDVSLHIATVTTATTGTGTGIIKVFLVPDGTTVTPSTVPVLTDTLHFIAGRSDTTSVTVDNNATLNSLFAGKSMVMSVKGTFIGPTGAPNSGPALSGPTIRFSALDAVVIAGRKLN